MNKLLIADDTDSKIDFLTKCIQRCGPEDLRGTPLLIARTTEEAVCLLLRLPEITAGFIDYEIPKHNGPHIIRECRAAEAQQKRPRAFLCLQTNWSGELFETSRAEAMAAGADDAISLRYNAGKSPVDAVIEILARMHTFLRAQKIS